MQGGNKKQNKTLPLEHEIINNFDYKGYFKTDEGKKKIEELYLLGKKYFKGGLVGDKKRVIYDNLIARKKELEEIIDEKIEFDDEGNVHVITYTRK